MFRDRDQFRDWDQSRSRSRVFLVPMIGPGPDDWTRSRSGWFFCRGPVACLLKYAYCKTSHIAKTRETLDNFLILFY